MDNNKNIDQYNGHEFVEIAGIKWATCNVGAEKPTDFGLYFQWGDTQGYTAEQVGNGDDKKRFEWADYKFNSGGLDPSEEEITKYNSTDGKTVLDAVDDAVQAAWGGAWRMPTREDFSCLIENTTSKLVENYNGSGVAGMVFTDKTDTSKEVFFPVAGFCVFDKRLSKLDMAFYWTSSLGSKSVKQAYLMSFYAGEQRWGSLLDFNDLDRILGYPVRGVADEWSQFDKYKISESVYDLSNAKDDEIVNAYKLLTKDDDVIAKE